MRGLLLAAFFTALCSIGYVTLGQVLLLYCGSPTITTPYEWGRP